MNSEQYIECPCGQWMRVDPADAGGTRECPRCGQSVAITKDALISAGGDREPGVASTEASVFDVGETEPVDASAPTAAPGESYTAEESVPAEWLPGDVILGVYEVKPVLESGRARPFHGAGGMGKVYKIFHRGWNADLAVKCPKPEILARAGGVQNFVRECETWVNLGIHPHIVSCYYARVLGGIPRVFAEYVEGGSLEDWIRDGRLYLDGPEAALKRILDIAIQFAWGLHFSHEQGLVHQDVKPGNVMMTPEGVAKVTDFGLTNARTVAGDIGTPPAGQHASASYMGMTQAYCSPEQAENAARRQAGMPRDRLIKLTTRTDVFSWAVSVLEMFKGAVTWSAGNVAAAALEEYTGQEPPEPHLPRLPSKVAILLAECLTRDPSHRPTTMQKVATRLCSIYGETVGRPYPRQESMPSELLADMLNNRAVSLYDLGRGEEAERGWRRALEADPGHIESTYNLALVEWRTARIADDHVLARIRKAGRLGANQERPAILEAQVHLERADCESALTTLETLTEPQRECPEARRVSNDARQRLAQSGRCIRVFEGHTGAVSSVCLSGDGRWALSGGYDHTVRMWNTETGQCVKTFEGHMAPVACVCFTPDGHRIISGSHDFTLRVWDIGKGDCLRVLKGHAGEVYTVTPVADGRTVLSGGADCTLRLWDTQTDGESHNLWGHSETVNSVHVCAGGTYAVSGSGSVIGRGSDKTARLWNLGTGRCERTFQGHTDNVTSVFLSQDARWLLSGSEDRTLRLWNAQTGWCLRTLVGHTDRINAVSVSIDGRYAVSSSHDRTVRLWETQSGRCLRTLTGHAGRVLSTCLSKDGSWALSGSEDGTLRLWNIGSEWTGRAPFDLSSVSPHQVAAAASAFPAIIEAGRASWEQGDAVAAAGHLRQARALPGHARHKEALELWQALYPRLPHSALAGGWLTQTIKTNDREVHAICLSADGRQALLGGSSGMIQVWDIGEGLCKGTLEGHADGVNALSMSADGRRALSGSDDKHIHLWDVETGRCLHVFEGHADAVNAVDFSCDSLWALSGSSDKRIRLWSVDTGHCVRILEGHTEGVHSACFSADARWALSGSSDKTLRLWDTKTGQSVRVFEGHTDEVHSVCMSVDGRRALSASGDKTLRLWEVDTGRCAGIFEGHTGRVRSVCLSADGKWALSGGQDKTLRMWEVDTGRCIRTFDGHASWVLSASLSMDAGWALAGTAGHTVAVWFLDWELEDKESGGWDQDARPHLLSFVASHTPYAGTLRPTPAPSNDKASQEKQNKPKRGKNYPPSLWQTLVGNLPDWSNIGAGAKTGKAARGGTPETGAALSFSKPTEQEIELALTRRGVPAWTEKDFSDLMYTLGCAGYGWLLPETVREQLGKMANTPRSRR